MKRWIKVPIEVDENGNCEKCPQRFVRNDYEFCPFNKNIIAGSDRCQACIDDDITDKLNAIDVLSEMLNNKIKPEMDVLEKRNAILERAMRILEKPYAGKAMQICAYAIEQAQKEIESEDGDVSKR